MIRQIQVYFSGIPAVFIDGMLYVIVAVSGAFATILAGDEASANFSARSLFWISTLNALLLQGANALKMFRSTAFAEHQQTKNNEKTDTAIHAGP